MPAAATAAQSQPDIGLSAAALAAIQTAVAAALAPLQTKVNALSVELQEIAKQDARSETEDEEDHLSETESVKDTDMPVDARSKRPLETTGSSIVTLRRSMIQEREAVKQRREAWTWIG